MKKSILVITFFIASLPLFAQEAPTLFAKVCRYQLAKRELPVDTIEQIRVTNKKLRKGKFVFRYKNAMGDADVKRSFVLEDPSGKQVYSADGSSFTMKAKELRQLLAQGPLKISSMGIPADPEKAKIVRVRPIVVAVISLVP